MNNENKPAPAREPYLTSAKAVEILQGFINTGFTGEMNDFTNSVKLSLNALKGQMILRAANSKE